MLADNKQHLNQRYLLYTRRYASLAAVLVAVAILAMVVVLVPQSQATWEVFQELQAVNQDVDGLEEKVSLLQGLPQSELLASQETVHQVLPSRKPLLELLTSLNQVAEETGIRFSEVSLTPGSIATDAAQVASTSRRTGSIDHEEMELIMNVQGSLNNINRFLRRVEQVAPITTVTSVSLSERLTRNDQSGGTDLFEAKMTMTTYFFTGRITSSVRSDVPRLDERQRTVLQEINTYLIPDVTQQNQIQGGGLEDLFGVDAAQLLQAENL